MKPAKSVANTIKCILPWIHVATNPDGQTRPCCISGFSNYFEKSKSDYPKLPGTDLAQVLMGPAAQTIRTTFENGSFPAACAICERKEKFGGVSKRMQENAKWQRCLHETVPKLRSLDIRLGNFCNLKCIMCGPVESSSWEKELELLKAAAPDTFSQLFLNRPDQKTNWYKAESSVWKNLWNQLDGVEEIYFAGGEPLLSPDHDWFLAQIISRNQAGHIKLQYNSNLTHLNDSLFEKWNHFKTVEINVSLDGLDGINDYLRYPSKFSKVIKNLKKLDKTPERFSVRITHTVSVLNFYYLDRFLEWKRSSQFSKIQNSLSPGDVDLNFIVFPEHLNLSCAPEALRQEFLQKIEKIKTRSDVSENFKAHLDSSRLFLAEKPPRAADRQKLIHYLDYLDKSRNLDYRNIFAEIANHFS